MVRCVNNPVRTLARGMVVSVSVALAATFFGMVGTANAATPAQSGVTVADTALARPLPPHPHRKFRAKFRTREECVRRGDHDYPHRRTVWECRPGKDRAHPWEIWSD